MIFTEMAAAGDSTGYGPRHRLMFDGDETRYELWECKFLGYMRLRNLMDVIVKKADEREADAPNAGKLAEAFAELIQFLDDRSLMLVMRDCKDNGRKALEVLREHYQSSGKPRVMSLYAELSGLQLREEESITDYMIRGETAATSLKTAGENITDSLLVAMILKGLPPEFKTFATVVTQRDTELSFSEFKVALRSFEESEKVGGSDSVMRAGYRDDRQQRRVDTDRRQRGIICYRCGKEGHKSFQCGEKRITCFACGREGHKAYECPEKQKTSHTGGKSWEKESVKVATSGGPKDIEEYSFVSTISCQDGHDYMMCDSAKSLLVDCGATAHIITDKAKFSSFENDFDPSKHYIELADGSRANNIVLGKGHATVSLYDVNGLTHSIKLENALYIPSFGQDIFSVQSAVERGANVHFSAEMSGLEAVDGTKFQFSKQGRLYYLNKSASGVRSSRTINEWHKVMGHCNVRDVLSLESVVSGMRIENPNSRAVDCETCNLGKMFQTYKRAPDQRATKPLEFIHTDLAGPVGPVAKDGFRYAMSFIDDYTGAYWIFFLKYKSDAYKALERYLAEVAPFGKVKRMRCDNGTEYLCNRFKNILLENQIRHEMSAPYSPHQNGTAERGWRTLFDTARCLLIESGVPKRLWTYAVLASAYIRNRCFNSRTGKTPYELLTGKVPDVSGMHVFGSVCYAYVQRKGKLDARSEKGIFVGYDRCSPAYLVYFSGRDEIRRVRCVRFTDKFDVTDDTRDETYDDPLVTEAPEMDEAVVPEHVEDRYPERERHKPQYLNDYVVNNATHSVDYCYLVAPNSYADAMSADQCGKWQEAMQEEFDALVENDTFELTEVPVDRSVVGGKWVYAVKTEQNGQERFKARYVAKGYSQTPDIDYKETFAPTARVTSIRMLLQLAIQEGMSIHQMDVKTAYLNAPIDCDIYMEQPEGFEKSGCQGEKLVWKLKKSLYGLKQSGHNWNKVLHQYLIGENFDESMSDPCVYTKKVGESKVILIVWVDDILIAASDETILNDVKSNLSVKFKMKDLGKMSWFLGMEVVQKNDYIEMSQKLYIQRLLERFKMSDCKPKATPCEVASGKLTVEESSPLEDTKLYRELVGSLIYLMTCTRPDICYIVTRLSQFLASPTKAHLAMGKHVLRYLKGTIGHCLRFEKCDKLQLEGYCDADWGSSIEDRRSISGFAFQLSRKGPLISWKSKKQQCVALSTCEAEYIALTAAVQEAKFLRQLYHDMYGLQDNVCIHVDNQGAIALAKNPVHHQRSKHIDIRYHFVRSEIQSGIVNLEYVPTELNVADVFTKPVSRVRIDGFVNLKQTD